MPQPIAGDVNHAPACSPESGVYSDDSHCSAPIDIHIRSGTHLLKNVLGNIKIRRHPLNIVVVLKDIEKLDQ